jgi:hypothetical protein
MHLARAKKFIGSSLRMSLLISVTNYEAPSYSIFTLSTCILSPSTWPVTAT